MKKALLLISAAAIAGLAQAATLEWGAGTGLLDTQSGNGTPAYGYQVADAGVDLYLIYNGVSGTTFGGVEYNALSGDLEFTGTGTAISFFDTFTTGATDFLGVTESITGIALDTFAPAAADWNNMDYSFTILSISDADGDLAAGAYYNVWTADLAGFSEATTAAGTGGIDAGGGAFFDVSGAGELQVVPEPATIGLFGLGALGAWFIRRSKRAQEEEEV